MRHRLRRWPAADLPHGGAQPRREYHVRQQVGSTLLHYFRYNDYFHVVIYFVAQVSRRAEFLGQSSSCRGEGGYPHYTCTARVLLIISLNVAQYQYQYHTVYYSPPMLRNTGLHPRVRQQLQGPLHPSHSPGRDQPRRRGECSGGVTYHCAMPLLSNASSQDYASSGRRVAVGGAA